MWREAFEHRFRGGDLDGHALGNLIIVGLTQVLGDFGRALEEAGRLLDCAGRVLPATTDPVVLTADAGDGGPESPGSRARWPCRTRMDRIRRVHIVPEDAKAHPEVVSAIELADQVVLAPGSLFTSLAPVLCVPAIREALAATRGRIVHVCNLQPQVPETLGPRRHRPPPGRARPRRPGRRASSTTSAGSWPPTRSPSGPWASNRWPPTWPGPTATSTTRPPLPRRWKASCSLPVREARQTSPTGGMSNDGTCRHQRLRADRPLLLPGDPRQGRRRRRRAGGGQRPVRRQRDDGVPPQARLRRRGAAQRGQGVGRRLLGRRERGPQARVEGPGRDPLGRPRRRRRHRVDRHLHRPGQGRRPPRRAGPSGSSSRRRRATPTP